MLIAVDNMRYTCSVVLCIVACVAGVFTLPTDEYRAPEDSLALDFFRGVLRHRDELESRLLSEFPDLADRIKRIDSREALNPHATFSCNGCDLFIEIVRQALAIGLNYTTLRPAVIELCETIVNGSGKHGRIICPGLMDNYGPHVAYIVKTANLTGRNFCLKLQICMPDQLPTSAADVVQQADWLASPHWTEHLTNSEPTERRGVLRIAHLTDIHVDLDYLAGTATDCGMMVCCRKQFPGTGKARRYGDKGCNIPPRTVQRVLQFIRNMAPPVNYVIYTGDNTRSSMFEETQGLQLNQTRWLAGQFQNILAPQLRVFPVIGNHETYPTNLYYIKRPEIQELNNKWADWWKDVAKFDETQLRHIRYAGYYTALPQRGLRILAYNSNYGYSMNFYNLLNEGAKDFNDMIEFMQKTLSDARKNKEKVILVGHHPTGGSESLVWYSRRISQFVIQFSDIIVLHVFGHKHQDKYTLVLDPKDNRAKGVEFMASSLTTSRNPSFRVYDLDSSSYQLQDFHNYYIDIEQTSVTGNRTAQIELLYSARKEYNMRSSSPEAWHELALRMTKDGNLFKKFHQNMFTRNGQSNCEGNCRKERLCDVFHANYDRGYACQKSVRGIYPQPRGGAGVAVLSQIVLIICLTLSALIIHF